MEGLPTIRILGVAGTPNRGGNTEQALAEALRASQTVEEVETELVSLAGVDIKPCINCLLCSTKGTRERPCPTFSDGMTELYPKMAEADGFIFASPVYYGSITGLMKNFMDRLHPFSNSYYYPDSVGFRGTLRFRPAGAIAVAAARNDGIEGALFTLYHCFLMHDMMIVGSQGIGNTYHTSGLGGAIVTEGKHNMVLTDHGGIRTVRTVGKKVATLAKALKNVRPQLEALKASTL